MSQGPNFAPFRSGSRSLSLPSARACLATPGGQNMTKPTIEQLRAEVRAPVLTSSDAGYDEARTVHNGMFDKRPAVIIRAEQAADVVAAVNFARDSDLDLSIKGGGHSAPGFGTN